MILAVLSILFVSVRLPVIITSMDKIFDVNELYIGTIAKELIEGPSLPLFDYQLTHIRGGTLLAGIFLVPFFTLLGQSYFVIKLAALFVSLMILAVSYLFLWKFFDRKVAIITGALMAVSAPLYTIFSSMLYGRDYESILLTMLAVSLFYRIFFQDTSNQEPNRKDRYFALFGLVSGVGMYFDYIFAVTLIYCFVFWFIFDKAFFLRRGFRFFLVFFAVGLSPWFFYNCTHHHAAICIDDNYPAVSLRCLFLLNSLPEVARKLMDLAVFHLPGSFYFKDFIFIPGNVLSYLYYGVYLLAFFFLFWANRKAVGKLVCGIGFSRKSRPVPGPYFRETFILLYPVAFSLLYGFSYYIISRKSERNFFGFYEYTYLTVLYPFIFISVAVFLCKLWDWCKGRRKIALVFPVVISLFLFASALVADYDLATFSNIGRRLVYEGYNYEVLGIVIGERYGQSLSHASSVAQTIRQAHRDDVYKGIGWNVGWRFFRGKEYPDISACIAQINTIDAGYRKCALNGFGAFLGLQLKGLAGAVSCVNGIEKQYRSPVYEGLGWFTGWRFMDRISLAIEQIGTIAEEYRPDFCRGCGELAGMIFGRDMIRCAELAGRIDPKYRPYFSEGFAGNR